MRSTLARGLAAGAAGVAALDAVTRLDMLLTGRPASDAPGHAAEAGLRRAGIRLSGNRAERASRRSALGALGGIVTGLGVGVVASVARRAGLRLPAPAAVTATGAAAMGAEAAALAATGVSDPRRWTAEDWARDIAPHLAYGATVAAVLRKTEPAREEEGAGPARRSGRLVTRSALLGVATGCRSTLGVVVPAVTARRTLPLAVSVVMLAGELALDKHPAVPSRLEGGALAARYASSALGALLLARQQDAGRVLPVLAAAAGTTLGATGGSLWREYAAARGWTRGAAVAEDAAALALAQTVVRLR